MKKVLDTVSLLIISLVILWVPILLIEETFLFDYIGAVGSFITSFILIIIGLFIYISSYKKIGKEKVNCYLYNIINTIILAISNVALGSLFFKLIESGIFHQCMGEGWDCFLFGIEYFFIGYEYALVAVVILVIWLIVKLIKYLIAKRKNVK